MHPNSPSHASVFLTPEQALSSQSKVFVMPTSKLRVLRKDFSVTTSRNRTHFLVQVLGPSNLLDDIHFAHCNTITSRDFRVEVHGVLVGEFTVPLRFSARYGTLSEKMDVHRMGIMDLRFVRRVEWLWTGLQSLRRRSITSRARVQR